MAVLRHKSWCFSSSPKVRKTTSGLNQSSRKSSFLFSIFVLFRSSVDWIGSTHLTEQICFTQSINPNTNLIQKQHYRHIRMLDQTSGRSLTQSCGHIKLITTLGLRPHHANLVAVVILPSSFDFLSLQDPLVILRAQPDNWG